jgi:triacylglycerol esterase/lipase EstA (alpha/beta hydrolase family)
MRVLALMLLLTLSACDEQSATNTPPPEQDLYPELEENDDTQLPPSELDEEVDEEQELPPPDCELPLAQREQALSFSPQSQRYALERCEELRLRFVAVAGQQLSIAFRFAPSEDADARGVALALAYPTDEPWSQALLSEISVSSSKATVVDWVAPRGGEFIIALRALEPRVPVHFELALECMSKCEQSATRYPILLVHGWTGWDSIGPYQYFFRVPEHLREGGAEAHVASLDPYNSVTVRAEQLAQQIDALLAEQHAQKLNIIAHSQGGLDARRAISALGYGDRIGALVTISTPHRGTPLSDVALGILPGEAQEALSFLLNLLGAIAVGSESDALASFGSLTEAWVQQEFNPQHPDDPRVSYLSYAGRCCATGEGCGDLCDVEIQFTHHLLQALAGDNDGVVPVSSAVWGEYLGEIPADHFDQVGQLAGVTGPNFNHLEFYQSVKMLLVERGF